MNAVLRNLTAFFTQYEIYNIAGCEKLVSQEAHNLPPCALRVRVPPPQPHYREIETLVSPLGS